ncbi:MAG: SP_1767 family glycosyltransferase [Clostridiales bacterium]|nr:SP_1767 family glycosyltransferase [Clostridiales bacterium]
MKKLIIFLLQKLYELKVALRDGSRAFFDFFYRAFTKPPIVAGVDETIDAIVKDKNSFARFGDGEIKLVSGIDISFQDATPFVVKKLREVLSSDDQGMMIGLPDAFLDRSRYNDDVNIYWKKHLARFRRVWYKYTRKGKKYYNASVTRQYITLVDRSESEDIYNRIKAIWDGRDVVLIEGEKTRMGVGNDLFDNVSSVRRILGPAKQAFDRYDEILQEAKKQDKNVLFLLALGPCATALAYDLHKAGYQAVDVGHIDVEYEWMKSGVKNKAPIKNKAVFEAGGIPDADTMDDPVYFSQIIAKII